MAPFSQELKLLQYMSVLGHSPMPPEFIIIISTRVSLIQVTLWLSEAESSDSWLQILSLSTIPKSTKLQSVADIQTCVSSCFWDVKQAFQNIHKQKSSLDYFLPKIILPTVFSISVNGTSILHSKHWRHSWLLFPHISHPIHQQILKHTTRMIIYM